MNPRSFLTDDSLRGEPYRILFPLGILCALAGLGAWIPFWLWPHAFPYPGPGHAAAMIQGFLLAFVFGFLGTMMPKVLGFAPLGPLQFVLFPLGLAALTGAALAGFPSAAQLIHLALLANFFTFLGLRWRTRRGTPPPAFAFIGIAFLADLAGTVFRLLALGGAWPEGARIGALLQFQGFILLLILGVGGFLLPKLLGNQVVSPEALRAEPPAGRKWLFPALGALLLFSFFLEAWGPSAWALRGASLLRALIWGWFLFGHLRLHRVPSGSPAYLAGARFSLVSIGLGLLMPAFFPAYLLAWEHVVFITGFLWLTLSIAARVTAAHGGRLDLLDAGRKRLLAAGWLIALAALTRVSSDIWTGGRWLHLALASLFAMGAIALWLRLFGGLFFAFPGKEKR